MSHAAISPISHVPPVDHSQAPSQVAAPSHDMNLQAIELAQQQQLFAMLMQNTQSSMMSQALQSPKDDEDED